MLSVYDSGEKYPITNATAFYIDHVDGGIDTLNFTIPVDDPIYAHLAEENRVEYGDNDYNIKSVDAPGSSANIKCEINLDFLKATFHKAYDSGSLTLSALLQTLLPPGWTISGYDPGISRTISLENATDYSVMKQALKAYSVALQWHTLTKAAVIINPNDKTPSGEYLTDELNLRSIAFKGESKDFITRLYPYGKDGLTISTVNDGIEYVENHQYSDKIVCGSWSDERYTVPTSLKTDAIKKLASLSVPARSYDCDVIDLAKLDSRYSMFNFAMYKVVTLIDRKRKIRLDHQIMEYKEYPEQPEKNVLTLSSVVSTVQDNIDQAQSTADEAEQGVAKATIEIGKLEITIKGKVSFSDLSESGKTVINGDNIITGKIQSENGKVYFDLANNKAAVSRLIDAGDSGIFCDIGTEDPQYGSAQGLFIYHGDASNKFAQIYRIGDSRHDGAQLLSLGPLGLFCNGGMGSRHANSLSIDKDGSDYGTVNLSLATPTGDTTRLWINSERTSLFAPNGDSGIALRNNDESIWKGNDTVFHAYGNTTDIYGVSEVKLHASVGDVALVVSSDGFHFYAEGIDRGLIDAGGFKGWINGNEGIEGNIKDADGNVWHFNGGILTGEN